MSSALDTDLARAVPVSMFNDPDFKELLHSTATNAASEEGSASLSDMRPPKHRMHRKKAKAPEKREDILTDAATRPARLVKRYDNDMIPDLEARTQSIRDRRAGGSDTHGEATHRHNIPVWLIVTCACITLTCLFTAKNLTIIRELGFSYALANDFPFMSGLFAVFAGIPGDQMRGELRQYRSGRHPIQRSGRGLHFVDMLGADIGYDANSCGDGGDKTREPPAQPPQPATPIAARPTPPQPPQPTREEEALSEMVEEALFTARMSRGENNPSGDGDDAESRIEEVEDDADEEEIEQPRKRPRDEMDGAASEKEMDNEETPRPRTRAAAAKEAKGKSTHKKSTGTSVTARKPPARRRAAPVAAVTEESEETKGKGLDLNLNLDASDNEQDEVAPDAEVVPDAENID